MKREYSDTSARLLVEFDRRFTDNLPVMSTLEALDPSSTKFMDTELLKRFSAFYGELDINDILLESQADIAKRFLLDEEKAGKLPRHCRPSSGMTSGLLRSNYSVLKMHLYLECSIDVLPKPAFFLTRHKVSRGRGQDGVHTHPNILPKWRPWPTRIRVKNCNLCPGACKVLWKKWSYKLRKGLK